MEIDIKINDLFNNENLHLNIDGLVLFVGPNGSGKSQVLRKLKYKFPRNLFQNKNVRYLSAGRLSPIENFRSDFDGHRGENPNYESASFGGTDWRDRRYNCEVATGDLHTLSLKPDLQIKVSERLRKLFNRDVFINWDAGNLKITFKRTDFSGKPYSSAREASGLLHLIVLLTAIYDNDIGLLLLDEPEVSLHPQLQSFLLQEMISVCGNPQIDNNKKIIVVATHSPEFIKITKSTDLSNFVFFNSIGEKPIQINPNDTILQSKKLNSFIARIGHTHKLAIFSKRPILVEGPSDVIVTKAIEEANNLYLNAAGVEIIPVIGKGQMPIVNKFFSLLGKQPVIIADLDGFADGLELINSFTYTKEINELAQKLGHESLQKMSSVIYQDYCTLIDKNWNDIIDLALNHHYWINRNDEIVGKRRAALATLFCESDEKLNKLNNKDVWISVKQRIVALFNLLEQSGCYFLRKGTVENYYKSGCQNSDKISLAVDESERIKTIGKLQVSIDYGELERALIFASQLKTIDEASALRDLLLAVTSPLLSRLGEINFVSELESLAYQILGERSSLFSFEIVPNEDGKEKKLKIDCKSTILNISGFPFELDLYANPITTIKEKIKNK
jgi:hypothetical protein